MSLKAYYSLLALASPEIEILAIIVCFGASN
jgi:hypothetical protein